LLSLLRLARPPRPALESARRVCPGPYRVQTAKATRLHAARMAVVLCRHDVHLVFLLRMAKAIRVRCLPPALPLLPAVAVPRAWLFHAQPAPANRLTKVPLLHPGPRDRLCRVDQA
jgi:hypothetical protein